MTGKSKQFLDPAQLGEALAQVAQLAAKEGVRIALLGGFALQHYGSDRLTGDIDLVAESRLQGLPAGTALSFGGEQTEAPNGVPVDLLLRDDDFAPLYEEALAHARTVDELPAPIVAREYLAAMKMVAGRPRDAMDLEFLILRAGMDRAKARKIIKRHLGPFAARELDRLVAELEWKSSQGLL